MKLASINNKLDNLITVFMNKKWRSLGNNKYNCNLLN